MATGISLRRMVGEGSEASIAGHVQPIGPQVSFPRYGVSSPRWGYFKRHEADVGLGSCCARRAYPPLRRRFMFAVFLLAGGWAVFRPPRRPG